MNPVLFVDFDGTLFDTVPVLWGCYQLFLKEFGICANRKDFEGFMGPSLSEVVIQLKKKYDIKQKESALLLLYESIVAKYYQDNISVFPRALESIAMIKSKGIRICIVTTAPLVLVKPLLEKQKMLNFFECIFSPLAGEPTKPNPAIYLRALKEMKTLPSTSIAIEDSKAGVKSAVSAGIKTFYFNEKKTWHDVTAFVVSEFGLE